MKKLISILIAFAITVLALVYALWEVDFRKLFIALTGVRYSVLAPLLAALVLNFWLKALRWAVILRPIGWFTWREVTPAMMIGFAANNVLPARLGELVRTVVFARRFRKPISAVLVSLVLERILDFTAVLILYFLAALLIGQAPQVLRLSAWIVAAATIVACISIFVLVRRPNLMLSQWEKRTAYLSESLRERGRTILNNVTLALSTVKSLGRLSRLLGNSLMQWGLMACNVWLALWAIGITLPPTVAIIVLAVTVLAATVPSAPGYIGPIQAAFVFALTPFGVTNEAAFAASVLFLVAQWIPVTAIGAAFYLSTGLGIPEAHDEIEDAERIRAAPRTMGPNAQVPWGDRQSSDAGIEPRKK